MATRSPRFNFGTKTYIMGVLNVTPDSFSDGGRFFDTKDAVRRGLEMASEGADIIDVGGESTRPGAKPVERAEEMERVIPVIAGLAKKIAIPISIDTRKSEVADGALKAGASIVNDVSGLKFDRYMAGVVSRHKAYLVVMHMKGEPEYMQVDPHYDDLMAEIIAGLKASVEIAAGEGIAKDRIIIDPGIGFGKTVEHNLEILNKLKELKVLNMPICVGASRKSFIGKILGIEDTDSRLAGTIAASVIAAMNGADILRVHDVRQAVEACRMADAVMKMRS